jgi:hypothetical protein
MALTLTQAAMYTQNKLNKGVIETLVESTPLLKLLPFATTTGNAEAVNMEDEDNLGSVEFRAPNATLTSSEANIEQVTFALKILTGDADVDSFLSATRGDQTDLMKTQIKIKTKLMGQAFENCCYYGNKDSTNQFDGFHAWGVDYHGQVVHCGSSTTAGVLTIAHLEEAMDLVRAGKPSAIIMSRVMRRTLMTYLRTATQVRVDKDEYGNVWEWWNETPIVVSDRLTNMETISGDTFATEGAHTGSTVGTSIFIVYFGDGDGVCGLQKGGITTELFPKLETKDAARCRIKWYPGLAYYNYKAWAIIDGIDADGTVTA